MNFIPLGMNPGSLSGIYRTWRAIVATLRQDDDEVINQGVYIVVVLYIVYVSLETVTAMEAVVSVNQNKCKLHVKIYEVVLKF